MREMVEVQHKDFKETAVVPKTALKHMKDAGWSEVSASKSKVAKSGENQES